MRNQTDSYTNQAASGKEETPNDQSVVETLQMVMRLAVGGAMEGGDELMRRLQERQQELSQNHAAKMTVFAGAHDETEMEKLRYALLGLLFETPAAMSRGLSSARQNTERATGLAAKLAGPLTQSRLARPFRRRYGKWAKRREALIDRLVSVGRAEEQSGRLLAREATVEAIDELLSYLAQKPELREIVQQQGMSLTGEVVNELRQRTAAADRLLDRVLGRRPESGPPAVVELPRTNSNR